MTFKWHLFSGICGQSIWKIIIKKQNLNGESYFLWKYKKLFLEKGGSFRQI